jgi:hypothetical protein
MVAGDQNQTPSFEMREGEVFCRVGASRHGCRDAAPEALRASPALISP